MYLGFPTGVPEILPAIGWADQDPQHDPIEPPEDPSPWNTPDDQ